MIKSFKTIIWTPNQSQPDIRPVGEVLYRLYEKASYEFIGVYKKKTSYFSITIPEGFICDGQSVPRILWSFMRPDGLVRMAALNHDILYRTAGGLYNPIPSGVNKGRSIKLFKDGKAVLFARKACDQVYRASYICSSPGEIKKARIGYYCLRLFGKMYFGKEMPGVKYFFLPKKCLKKIKKMLNFNIKISLKNNSFLCVFAVPCCRTLKRVCFI